MNKQQDCDLFEIIGILHRTILYYTLAHSIPQQQSWNYKHDTKTACHVFTTLFTKFIMIRAIEQVTNNMIMGDLAG